MGLKSLACSTLVTKLKKKDKDFVWISSGAHKYLIHQVCHVRCEDLATALKLEMSIEDSTREQSSTRS